MNPSTESFLKRAEVLTTLLASSKRRAARYIAFIIVGSLLDAAVPVVATIAIGWKWSTFIIVWVAYELLLALGFLRRFLFGKLNFIFWGREAVTSHYLRILKERQFPDPRRHKDYYARPSMFFLEIARCEDYSIEVRMSAAAFSAEIDTATEISGQLARNVNEAWENALISYSLDYSEEESSHQCASRSETAV